MDDITKKNENNLDPLLAYLNGIGEEARKDFFYDNRENMDTLVWYYCDEFKNAFYKDIRERLEKYLSCICDETEIGCETEEKKWWIHTGRVLGIYWGEIGKHRVGIECVFKNETYDKKLGEFHIYVASWDQPDFKISAEKEKALKEAFLGKPIDNKSAKNRAFIPIAVLDPDKQENDIISTLKDTYNTLKAILQ